MGDRQTDREREREREMHGADIQIIPTEAHDGISVFGLLSAAHMFEAVGSFHFESSCRTLPKYRKGERKK